jgi:uncharacterized Zn ribbon protein
MSVTKSNDHSYYYLQKAKKFANCTGREWDNMSKVKRDEDEEQVRDLDNTQLSESSNDYS